ncbi:unnamed protein product [Symbiodinium sp. CCMP2592]|nr:unnamed protein product [Symbiodinium sp. CCMP2592]
MPFTQSFGGNSYLNINISSEEEVPPDFEERRRKDEAADVAMIGSPIDISDEDSLATAEPTIADRNAPSTIAAINQESKFKGGLMDLWGCHSGHGACTGSNQLKCYFGANGQPAKAGPDGRCDLCSSDSLTALYEDPRGQARITYLLKHLDGKNLKHAYARIKIVLGKAIQQDFQFRRQRALRRSLQRPKAMPKKSRRKAKQAAEASYTEAVSSVKLERK